MWARKEGKGRKIVKLVHEHEFVRDWQSSRGRDFSLKKMGERWEGERLKRRLREKVGGIFPAKHFSLLFFPS